MVSVTFITATIILGITAAQSIDYSSLPSCAQQCTLLTQANQACLPAPVYLSCFCQSAYLTGLSSSAASICPVCTSSSDQQAIVSWFNSQCQSGSTGTTVAATTSITAATGTTPTPTATGNSAPSYSSSDSSPTWWSQHYQWIIMVIVLLIGFGIIIAVGIMLKKRHNRKRNMAGNSGSGAVPVWGPSYDQDAMRGSALDKEMGVTHQGPANSGGIGARAKNMLRH